MRNESLEVPAKDRIMGAGEEQGINILVLAEEPA